MLFIIGFVSLVLSFVGVKLSYLVWIDGWGGLPGFIIRILMVISGIVIVYLTLTDWRSEEG